ncbi:MAG: deoxyribose-phosphate aldolase [Candidatus Berkiella sp.]
MTLLSFLDVTCLEEQVTETELATLCDLIRQAPTLPAAICVYPQHLQWVKTRLSDLELAFTTVINFPQGTSTIEAVKTQIQDALQLGATELDIVLPYDAFLDTMDLALVKDFITACCNEINGKSLFKLILETGEIEDRIAIYEVSLVACEAGVDFIKTSTGKVPVGATLEATGAILQAINDFKKHRQVGLKVSGGIRTPSQAQAFYDQIETKLGRGWLTPKLFRIGASQLFKTIAFAKA